MGTAEQGVGSVRASGSRGRLVVVVLVVIGVAAGAVSVSFWSEIARFGGWDRGRDGASEGAGSVAWDPQAAAQELEDVQQALNDAIADKRKVTSSLGAVWRVVERYPQYASARMLLAQALMYDGQGDQAYEQLEKSLALDGQQPEVHVLAGTLALQGGRLEQARHHYSMAVGLDRSNPRYYLHLAQVYIKMNDLDKARHALLEALAADSGSDQAYASLADVYAQQNKLQLAIGQMDNALRHVREDDVATRRAYVRRKAKLLRRANRPEEALQVLLALGPGQTDVHYLADVALCWGMMGRPEDAAEAYEAAMVLRPLESLLAVEAARWRIKAGDTAMAREHLSQVRRVNPQAAGLVELEEMLGG